MTRFLRPIRSGILIVAAASLLASCKDEGGVLDVFFWAEGRGDCERITVTIDMQSADALLAPPIEGRDQCDIYKALENAGCDFEVETLAGPDRLQVTIDDCRIDDRSGLFRCAFSDGTLEDLEMHTTAVCDCFGSSCDETPRLCLSDNSEDEACETSVPDTSSTTSSSTTTSTSFGNSTEPTMSTSTTTMFPIAERYAVEFGIDNGAGIGAIEFDIDYAAIAGAAARNARAVLSDPQCKKLVSSATATFDYSDSTETIHVEMTNLPGTSGPLELADCSFATSTEPVSSDFNVNVVEARNLAGGPIGAPPAVEVGNIEPFLDLTTTTLQALDTTTTTLAEPQVFEVTFRVDSASDEIGALQWATSYESAAGSFVGSGNRVECGILIETLFARNDKDRVCSEDQFFACNNNPSMCALFDRGTCSVMLDELVLGVVSVEGFDAPVDLVRCVFSGTSTDPPQAGDFDLAIEDATDREGTEISVSISVSVVEAP